MLLPVQLILGMKGYCEVFLPAMLGKHHTSTDLSVAFTTLSLSLVVRFIIAVFTCKQTA